jgi:hypothetical protein
MGAPAALYPSARNSGPAHANPANHQHQHAMLESPRTGGRALRVQSRCDAKGLARQRPGINHDATRARRQPYPRTKSLVNVEMGDHLGQRRARAPPRMVRVANREYSRRLGETEQCSAVQRSATQCSQASRKLRQGLFHGRVLRGPSALFAKCMTLLDNATATTRRPCGR